MSWGAVSARRLNELDLNVVAHEGVNGVALLGNATPAPGQSI